MVVFAGIMFGLIGFIMIALVTAAMALMTEWKRFYPTQCAIVVFVATTACFVSRFSISWHTMLRPIIVTLFFYAAMRTGLALGTRGPKEEGGEELF